MIISKSAHHMSTLRNGRSVLAIMYEWKQIERTLSYLTQHYQTFLWKTLFGWQQTLSKLTAHLTSYEVFWLSFTKDYYRVKAMNARLSLSLIMLDVCTILVDRHMISHFWMTEELREGCQWPQQLRESQLNRAVKIEYIIAFLDFFHCH